MIEELKLIIEMLGGIQEDAYTLVVAYFCFMLLKWAVVTGAVIYFLKLGIITFFDSLFVHELRNIIFPQEMGSALDNSERTVLKKIIIQYKENN